MHAFFEVFLNEVFFVFKNRTWARGSHNNQMEEINSSEQSVIIAQDVQQIQDVEEKNSLNRAQKAINRAANSESFSEVDIFGSSIDLNFNGEKNYKTVCGGLTYCSIMTTTIILTYIFMFPNGLVVNSKISAYSVLDATNGKGQTMFDFTDQPFRIFAMNYNTKQQLVGPLFQYFIQNASVWQVTGTKKTKLQAIYDTPNGYIYFPKSNTNAGATVSGTGIDKSYIQVELLSCQFFGTDPVWGPCMNLGFSVIVGVELTTYTPISGKLLQKRQKAMAFIYSISVASVEVTQFSTNNKFFGYISNVLSYKLKYYDIWPDLTMPANAVVTQVLDPNFPCFDASNTNFRCTIIRFQYSGTTNIGTEIFDNITDPLLFFIAVSQTLLFLIYSLFVKNYNNNCLTLKLADTLVYIPDENGRHINFKEGAAIFIACLIHRHLLLEIADNILFKMCQKHVKNYLPIRSQLAMFMIDYGHNCLVDRHFYGELNDMFSQENCQPAKINFDYDYEEPEEEEIEEPEHYFDDEIKEEAFKRMCEEHDYYSVKRKTYIRDILLQEDRKYKLVILAQQLFDDYCQQVQKEVHVKQIELPISFQNDELSGQNLKKQNFY